MEVSADEAIKLSDEILKQQGRNLVDRITSVKKAWVVEYTSEGKTYRSVVRMNNGEIIDFRKVYDVGLGRKDWAFGSTPGFAQELAVKQRLRNTGIFSESWLKGI